MLKEILSISGKSGLFKHISQAKNMIIVESLIDGKRFPAYSHDRVVSLGDISIFTDEGEVKLYEVFTKLQELNKGEKAPYEDANAEKLLVEVIPNYDRNRVHKSDIRKIFTWYNLLVEKGFTDFTEKADEETTTPARTTSDPQVKTGGSAEQNIVKQNNSAKQKSAVHLHQKKG